MQRYSEAAWERVMKVQEVILRAMAKRITREVGGADWADREHALARNAGGMPGAHRRTPGWLGDDHLRASPRGPVYGPGAPLSGQAAASPAGRRRSLALTSVALRWGSLPFANFIARYQQVYSSGSFGPLPFDIAAISFFKTLSLPLPDAVTSATYNLSFSTTCAPVGGLDPLLDPNVGFDNQVFFSGNLGGTIGTTLTIVGASVFHYNPVLGNLLLDMTLSGASPDTNIALDVENFSSVMSRAAPGLSDPFNLGLVTEFSTTAPPPPSAVPEPSSLLLFGTGLLGLVGAARRKWLG